MIQRLQPTLHPLKPPRTVYAVKRFMDIIAGSLGILLFFAIYPIVALLIKMDSKGPVIYKQVRVGCNRRSSLRDRRDADSHIVVLKNRRKGAANRRGNDECGAPFQLYKFRTMITDAEAHGPQLCAKQSDTRITRIGWWLRYLHIDEIPQFWNILRGEMSLIGPRPERPFFTKKYRDEIPHYEERTRYIKPGLTGLAQITLGYDESLQTVGLKYAHDINYRIASASFSTWIRLEFWIVGNTIRYLWNHVWNDIRKRASRKVKKEASSNTPPPKELHHIAHPWKLIDRITERQEQFGQEIPSYIKEMRP